MRCCAKVYAAQNLAWCTGAWSLGAKRRLHITSIVSQGVKRVLLQDEQVLGSESGESPQPPFKKLREWRFTASIVYEALSSLDD
jgi:hypothetical protein